MRTLVAVPALAQDEPAVVADSTKAPTAKAGGAEAKVDCPDGIIESKAGGVVAKTDFEPAPKALPAPAPKAEAKALPQSGGILGGTVSLIVLGAGALLLGVACCFVGTAGSQEQDDLPGSSIRVVGGGGSFKGSASFCVSLCCS